MDSIIKRPMDRILEEAACNYYGVRIDFFKAKGKDGQTDKRRVLFWLLNQDCSMSSKAIGDRYGYSKASIAEGIAVIDFRKGQYAEILKSIEKIRQMASDAAAQPVELTDRELLIKEVNRLKSRGWSLRKIGKEVGKSHQLVKLLLQAS